MANIARLGVVLGLSSAEFVAGIDKAKQKTKELQTSFVDFAKQNKYLGLALVATTQQIMAFADELADTASTYQTSIKSIMNLSEALSNSGGKAENAGRLFGQFYNKIDEAAQGSKEAQEAFQRIGITLDDLAKASPDELFDKTIKSLASMEDPIKRNALAFEIMGRAVRGVDIKNMNRLLEQGFEASDKQQEAIAYLADKYDELGTAIFKAKIKLAEALMPVLKLADIQMRDFGSTAALVGKGIELAFVGVIASVSFVVESIKWAISALANLNSAAAAMMTGGSFFETLKNLGSENNERFFRNLKEVQDAVRGKGSSAPDAFGGGRNVKAADAESEAKKIAQLLKQLETLRFISIEYENHLQQQVLGIETQTQMLYLTKNEAQVYQAMYELEKKRSDEVAKMQEKRAEAVAAGADQKVIAEIDNQIAKINELADTYRTRVSDAITANQDLTQSMEGGFLSSFQKFQYEAINSAQWVEAAVDSVFSNMTAAINQFVETGKFSFADFTKAIIQDLIKIQMQMLLTQLFAKAIGFAMGAFGSVGGTPYTSAGQMTAGTSVVAGAPMTVTPLGNANGGSVDMGMPYYVGEMGPELFVPSRSGTIIPNNALSGLGNQPQVIYNGPYIANMSAIDTQSAMQFLAKNKMAVYSANMSATRSIPTSVR